jgi:hypothetical protein
VRVDVRGSGGSPGVLDPFGIGRTALIGDDSEGLGAYQPYIRAYTSKMLIAGHRLLRCRRMGRYARVVVR